MTFYTLVRVMVRYVHYFFSEFFEKFSIYSDFSKKPGANAPVSQIAAPVFFALFCSFVGFVRPCVS
jgi:formate hydrogenlyase subunit 3/multisubunit Na+/H+ antiporter MnhD subunit